MRHPRWTAQLVWMAIWTVHSNEFRKAHEHLEPGHRAGLVATNSITQNRARPVTLEHILEEGGVIFDAVSSQDWPGEAAVDVSIVNWLKAEDSEPAPSPRLDGVDLDEPIAASLRPWSAAVERSKPLSANEGKAFFGPIPGASGFVLTEDEAHELLAGKPNDWREVVRPYLIGDNPDEGPAPSSRALDHRLWSSIP